MRKLPTRYWGPWKEEFYSLHSNPKLIEDDKKHEFGIWKNVWVAKLSRRLYKASPDLWRWWANHRFNPSKGQLKQFFPNLK